MEYSEIIKRYKTSEEDYLIGKTRKYILLINPIFVVILILSFLLFFIYSFDKETSYIIYNILIGILTFSAFETASVLIFRRIKFMNKANWNNVVPQMKAIMSFKDQLTVEEAEIAIGEINKLFFKALGIYYFLASLLSLLIYIKENTMIITAPFTDDPWRAFIITACIFLAYIVFSFLRLYLFTKSISIMTSDLEKGNIKSVKESILNNTKRLNFWGMDYIVAFREMSDVVDLLNKKGKEADARTKERMELVTNASHDIKTPLTSLISYSNILRNNKISDVEYEEYKNILKKKSRRLNKLMNEIKDVYNEDRDGDLKIDKAILNFIIEESIDNNKEKIKELNLNVYINKPLENAVASIDIVKTERIFQNLISNICKYSRYESKVEITITNNENDIKVVVINESKTSIKESEQELLRRFNRGDKSRKTEGYGLGLNIIEKFMKLQGGELELDIDGIYFKVILTFKRYGKI